MKPLKIAALQKTAEKAQAEKALKAKQTEAAVKAEEERTVESAAKYIMEHIELQVTQAAAEGKKSVVLMNDTSVPKGAWDRGWLWDVTHRVRHLLEITESDLTIFVGDDPWLCEGGEGHIAIFASWGTQ